MQETIKKDDYVISRLYKIMPYIKSLIKPSFNILKITGWDFDFLTVLTLNVVHTIFLGLAGRL